MIKKNISYSVIMPNVALKDTMNDFVELLEYAKLQYSIAISAFDIHNSNNISLSLWYNVKVLLEVGNESIDIENKPVICYVGSSIIGIVGSHSKTSIDIDFIAPVKCIKGAPIIISIDEMIIVGMISSARSTHILP
jgi:hypothetical protein